jgi:hypothetical protein
VLKTNVCDGCAARQVDAFDAIGGVDGNVRHASIGDVFAVAQRQPPQLRAADNGTRW